MGGACRGRLGCGMVRGRSSPGPCKEQCMRADHSPPFHYWGPIKRPFGCSLTGIMVALKQAQWVVQTPLERVLDEAIISSWGKPRSGASLLPPFSHLHFLEHSLSSVSLRLSSTRSVPSPCIPHPPSNPTTSYPCACDYQKPKFV